MRNRELNLLVSVARWGRFRNLLKHLRLRSPFRSGCHRIRKQEVSGPIRFRNPGLPLPRSGLSRRAKVLGLALLPLKEALLGPVPVQFRVRLDSDHLSRQGRVVRARLAIPTPRGQDNQAPLELLHRSDLISHVLRDRLRKEELGHLSVGRSLNRGVPRNRLRKERPVVRLKLRTFQSLHHSARIKVEPQRDSARRTTRIPRRIPLAERWIGTRHWIQY